MKGAEDYLSTICIPRCKSRKPVLPECCIGGKFCGYSSGLRGKVRFFPVEAVVFSAAEMGYQLAFQRLEILVGNFIEQVADSPRNMYLFVSIGNRRIGCYPLECTVD